MTDRIELLQRLHGLERACAPYGILVDGAPLWPLLRVSLGARTLRSGVRRTSAVRSMGAFERIATLASGIPSWIRLKEASRDRPLLFFTERAFQSRTPLGTVDRFAHPLMEAAWLDGIPSELIMKDAPPDIPLIRSAGVRVRFGHAALRIVAFKHWRSRPTQLAELIGGTKLWDDIVREFDPEAVRFLDTVVHNFRMYLRIYRTVLRNVKPRHVFVTCWYAVDNIAIAHVCAELGIPCTDLQHGVQGPSHLAYAPWYGIPDEGCSGIPSSFWCWDEASATNIRAWAPAGRHRPFVGGSPWLEGFAEKVTDGVTIHKDRVLFSLQPITQYLPSGLEQLVERTPSGLTWVFRLHPMGRDLDGEILRWAVEHGIADRVVVEDPVQVSLGRSLQCAALHLTQFSSVIREAALMGVVSFALHPNAVDAYPDLIANGKLICTDDIASIPLDAVHLTHGRSGMGVEPDLHLRLRTLMEMDPTPQ